MKPPNLDPLDILARAYMGQGLDTLVRLLRLTPADFRHRVLFAWRLTLETLATLSEDDLANTVSSDRILRDRFKAAWSAMMDARAARPRLPSQGNPPEGP